SIGVFLDTAPPSIAVTLSLDPAGQNADIQIVNGSATFLIQGALNNNYDPAERFEILYTGTLDPFIGPVDFLLEPAGFPAIPLRVHLNVTERSGFPVPFVSSIDGTAPIWDITGDQRLDIVVPGAQAGVRGLHAFDDTGTPLNGWPFRLDEPDILSQNYFTPALVDLDRDGKDEVVVIGWFQRDVPDNATIEGFVFTASLFALDGSGNIRWQVTDDIKPFSVPAVADLNGDRVLDIVVGGGANLKRYDSNGVLLAGWRVETLNDISVTVPVIADVNGMPGDGLEIVACSPVFGFPRSAQVYVWNQDGSLHHPAWPKTVETCHAPAVVDLDGDPTNGREIVMAIDHDPPEVDPATGLLKTFTVFAWHADGTDVSGWPHRFLRDPTAFADDRVPFSPSVGDLDGDGDMEVVVGTYGQGNQANGNLFVFHHDGTLDPNWPQWAGTAQVPSVFGGTALGDLDNDGRLEIVTGSALGVHVFRANGGRFEGFPRLTTENFAQPMIADLDGDGRLEIVEVSLLDALSVWTVLTSSPDADPWPRYRQNPARTGTPDRLFVAPIPTVSAVGLAVTLCLLLAAGVHIIRRNARRATGA
ncbi:MAG: FG-GAP repeat domain-containing protein, partial [Phycisphaerae bacterium]